MYDAHDHTLSPACWCDPLVLHVPSSGPALVLNARDAERAKELGLPNVVVSPDVPTQREQ